MILKMNMKEIIKAAQMCFKELEALIAQPKCFFFLIGMKLYFYWFLDFDKSFLS